MWTSSTRSLESPLVALSTWTSSIAIGAANGLLARKFQHFCLMLTDSRHHCPLSRFAPREADVFDRMAAKTPFTSDVPGRQFPQ